MTDMIFYYLFIGLIFNLIMAVIVTNRGYNIDPVQVVASILIWPIGLVATINTLLKKD